jgi:hypothetical protein
MTNNTNSRWVELPRAEAVARMASLLREAHETEANIQRFTDEAMAGDYNHMQDVFSRWGDGLPTRLANMRAQQPRDGRAR